MVKRKTATARAVQINYNENIVKDHLKLLLSTLAKEYAKIFTLDLYSKVQNF